MKYYIFIIGLGLALFSCSTSKEGKYNFLNYKIDSTRLVLPVPERNSIFLRYKKIKEQEYFTTFDDLHEMLIVYDIKQHKTYQLDIGKIEPNPIEYTFVSFDSIWVVSEDNRIVLIDSALHIKKEIHPQTALPIIGQNYRFVAYEFFQMIQQNNRLYGCRLLKRVGNRVNFDSIATYGNREAAIDLVTDSVQVLKGAFPASYPARIMTRDFYIET